MKPTLAAMSLSMLAAVGSAHDHAELSVEQLRNQVSFAPVAGSSMPSTAAFADENDRSMALRYWVSARPTFLALVYYDCEDICDVVEESLLSALRATSLQPGMDYDVVLVSLADRETPSLARARKQALLAHDAPQEAAAWHFLTGNAASIAELTQAAGVHYVSSAAGDRIAHPAGILLLEPPGRIAQYFPGVEFHPGDLRHAIIDASAGRTGSFSDRVWLLCHHYDPSTGRYGPLIFTLMRALGTASMLGVALLLVFLWRNERGKRRVPD